MTRFAKFALFVLVLYLVAIPAGAQTGETCDVLADPTGDAGGFFNAFGLSPTAASDGNGSIDITKVAMGVGSDDLVVEVTVKDLSAPLAHHGDGAIYTVYWELGEGGYYFVRANLSSAGWKFSKSVPSEDGYGEVTAASGSVDTARHALTIAMPLSAMGNPARGESLTKLAAHSAEIRTVPPGGDAESAAWVGIVGDYAPDSGTGRFVLDSRCPAGPSATGERCLILEDSPNDAAGGLLSEPVDPATEILSLQMGANRTTLVIEVAVADLSREVPDGWEAERWEVRWRQSGANSLAFAERSRGGESFGYQTADDAGHSTVGSLDPATGVVQILIPRDDLEAADGTRLGDIRVQSWQVKSLYWEGADSAPSYEEPGGTFVVGVSCAQQEAQACPVVLDVAGDAGPIIRWDGTEIPENQPALDLLAAGADARGDEIVASARLADLSADPPTGFDTVGWTVSWFDDEHKTRWFAQAQRSPSGTAFSYGVDESGYEYYPSGPIFGGTETTGSLDPAAGVVSIRVARAGVGDPADGTPLEGFGASSWALSSGNTVATYEVVDSTEIGRYEVGLACGV